MKLIGAKPFAKVQKRFGIPKHFSKKIEEIVMKHRRMFV